MEKLNDLKKKYKWNNNKLIMFIITTVNMLLVGSILYNIAFNSYFLKNQLGLKFDLKLEFKISIILVSLLLALFLNYRFIKKDLFVKKLISLIQTVGYAFVIRNLAVAFVFYGFSIQHYYMKIVALIIMSLLIYMTMFSLEVINYFSVEEGKKA